MSSNINIILLYDEIDENNILYCSSFREEGEKDGVKFYKMNIRIEEDKNKSSYKYIPLMKKPTKIYDYRVKLCTIKINDFISKYKAKNIKFDGIGIYYSKLINVSDLISMFSVIETNLKNNCAGTISTNTCENIHGVFIENKIEIPKQLFIYNVDDNITKIVENLICTIHDRRTNKGKLNTHDRKCILL